MVKNEIDKRSRRRRQRHDRLPGIPHDDGAQDEGHGLGRGDPRGIPRLRQGRQRVHFGGRVASRHDQFGREAHRRGGRRDDPRGRYRRRRTSQLRR